MKNTVPSKMVGSINCISLQSAPAKLPISQNVILCIPSALFAKYTIKLENALQTELKAIPAKRSFIEFDLPPILDINNTSIDTINAPINPQTPIAFVPNRLPIPNITATVAPNDAPDDTPNIYGSANGFLTIACITIPTTDSPIPTPIAKIILGNLINHTTSFTAESITIFKLNNLLNIIS
ncbi:hypothetical protein SDC9_136864 [bioreactor metagenome]|uniref:Uncharacterized protein n=1 Tax=bioreactor metagenome TaxID=1076179 RepID=A0A645DMJ2_9ZZZZ